MKFSIKDFFSKSGLFRFLQFPQETADLVTFTEEILNGKLHFLCSDEIYTLILKYTFKIGIHSFMTLPKKSEILSQPHPSSPNSKTSDLCLISSSL